MTTSWEDWDSTSLVDSNGDERTNASNNATELSFDKVESFFDFLAADMSSSELTSRAPFFLGNRFKLCKVGVFVRIAAYKVGIIFGSFSFFIISDSGIFTIEFFSN